MKGISREILPVISLARKKDKQTKGMLEVGLQKRGGYYEVYVCGCMSRRCTRVASAVADWLAADRGVNTAGLS